MFPGSRRSPRLAQWNGRRRSSRSDAFDWRALLCRRVVARLVVVACTCLFLTYLVADDGPPFAYRLGQTVPRDVRARVDFRMVDQPEAVRIRTHAARPAPTHGTRAGDVEPEVMDYYPAGLILVLRDNPISTDHLQILRAEHEAFRHTLSPLRLVGRTCAVAAIIVLLTITVILYTIRFQPATAKKWTAVLGICTLICGTFALACWLDAPPWHAAALPLTVTAMILAIAFNPPFALFMSVCLAILMAIEKGGELSALIVLLGGQTTAVLAMRQVRTRSRPVEVGVIAGVALGLMTIATDILTGQSAWYIAGDAGRNLICGILAGCVITGCLPAIERAFGIVTDARLLELGDCSHPLLQELLRRAPGTYTHSMMVATLAEAGAEAIGANPLLTRVGCYYHDVGKMLKPQYFIENQTGINAHDQLEPTLSSLVIVGHVKDGIALGEQYRLPRPIIDFIHQHHGTTLVEYFYREALRIHSSTGGTPESLEPTFRYPGPKPQTREAAVIMMADVAESAGRALPHPSAVTLRKIVHDLAMKRLLDGQFDECDLSLHELKCLEDAIAKALIAVYHSRVQYPAPEALPKSA